MVEVAVAIILDNDRVLLSRRPPGSHLEGLWEFPGGKLEVGETAQECAAREALEETGMIVSPDDLLEVAVYEYPERAIRIHFWICHPIGGVLNPALLGAEWALVSALPSLEMPAANKSAIRQIVALRTQGKARGRL